jgi:transcriptional regulator with XRE-family HTH domain
MKKNVSENIRLLRESKGFSQEYIANKMGVSQQAYSNMEKKPETMTLARIRDLAKVLDVNMMVLLNEESVLIQQNFNQQGGNAATHLEVHQQMDQTLKVYEDLIQVLKDEINFLRSERQAGSNPKYK